MKFVRRTLAALLCSLATSVSLSWLAATVSTIPRSTFETPPKAGDLAGGRVRVPNGWTPRTWLVGRGIGIRYDLISESVWAGSTLGSSPTTAPNRTLRIVSTGWPFPALQWTEYPTSTGNVLAVTWNDGIAWSRTRTLGAGISSRLPIRPVWLGLMANAALYCAVFLLLFWWRGRRRQAGRRARNECEACGYALGGLPRCPECGQEAAVVSRPIAPAA